MSWQTILRASLLATVLAGSAAAATFEVRLEGFSFVPPLVEIRVGDTVRWRNTGGVHDVVADNGAFRSGPPSGELFTFERTFLAAGDIGYHCSVHGAPGAGMSGTVRVSGDPPPPAGPAINEGLAGTWFNAQTDGQGFLVEVHPGVGLLTVGWFTWTDQPGVHDWISGLAQYQANRAEINWFRSRGGRFNAADPVQTTPAGTGVLTFTSCTTARLDFTLTDPVRSGSIALGKLLPAGAQCQEPATQ